MKKLLLFPCVLLSIFLLIGSTACQKQEVEPEPDVVTNPCEGCVLPKICQFNECVCPPGYTGDACNEEKLPSAVSITQVTLLEFPMVDNNGNAWDEDGGPDLSIGIWASGSHTADPLYRSGTVHENASSPGEYEFPNASANMNDMEKLYGIFIFDDDLVNGEVEPQLMTNIVFKPYEPGTDFPAEVIIEDVNTSTGEVRAKARIKVSYSF